MQTVVCRTRISIAVISVPLRPTGWAPGATLRLLVSVDEGEGYEVLAGRLEFPSAHVSVPADEMNLAAGDVIVGVRDGYLEDVLVQRMSEEVEDFIAGPSPCAPQLAVAGVRCVCSAWRHLTTFGLAEPLITRELCSPCGELLAGLQVEGPWRAEPERLDICWITS